MKLFLAGDDWSGTGPANVTKSLLQALPKETLYLKKRNKAARAVEILVNTLKADVVLYSGFSVQNLLGFRLSKLLKKTSFYLIHGSVDFEGKINDDWNSVMAGQEFQMLQMADYILAVSEQFAQWLTIQYPQFAGKIYFVTNGIDWSLLPKSDKNIKKDDHCILTIGGGMPRKNIVSVCKAIELIYEEQPDCSLRLIVLGADGKDTEAIKKYPFVEYRGVLSYDNTLNLMRSSTLYIQNSLFETFGLAPIEALLCGCNLLLSKCVGAISVIENIHSGDIINEPNDYEELKEKIKAVLVDKNCKRLLSSINREKTSVEYRVWELLQLIQKLEEARNER